MKLWRKRLGWLLLALTVLAFVGATAFLSVRLLRERDLVLYTYRSGTWVVVQLQTELLRLSESVSRYWARGSEEGRDEVQLRFELFWSRFPIVLETEEGEGVRQLEGVVQSLSGISAQLPLLEGEIAALDPRNPASFDAVLARLEGFRPPIYEVVQRALLRDLYVYNRERLQRTSVELIGAAGAVFLLGALLVLLLLRQILVSQRHLAQVEAARRESVLARDLLVDAIASSSEGFLLLDRDERIVMVNDHYRDSNPAARDLLVPGAFFPDIVWSTALLGQYRLSGSVQSFVRSRLARLRQPEGAWEETLADGRTMLVNERRTRQGGLVSVRTDITAQKQAESLLRQRLLAIEASDEGIALCDREGRFTFVNRAFLRVFGCDTHVELLGWPWKQVCGAADRNLFDDTIQPELKARGRWRGEVVGRRRDGSRFPQEISLTALADGGLICVTRDISERKRAETERIALEAQFHQAQKMEALGRLAGGIAHDFNNILATMLGYASFLLDDLPPGSELHGFAQQILRGGARARDLVQQILAYSRAGDVGRHPLELGPVVAETIEMLRATLPADVALSFRVEEDALVEANATQINQVVMNLCVNARDAVAEKGGRILISLSIVALAAEQGQLRPGVLRWESDGLVRLRLGEVCAGRFLCLAVSDSGGGIEPQGLERIFEPFYTTKEPGKGSGLGLSAVQGIVAAHGGCLEVRSRPGSETSFLVYLPLAGLDAGREGPHQSRALLPALASHSILVVDDEAELADMTRRLLLRLGYRGQAAIHPEAAISLLESAAGKDIALVITDQAMPGMTGLELIGRLKNLRPDVPCILSTGFAEDLDESQAQAAGAYAILRKPFEPHELAFLLRDALGTTGGEDRGAEALLSQA